MDTKIVNDKFNQLIKDRVFKDLTDNISEQVYKFIEQFEFETEDDLKLIASRLEHIFISELEYKLVMQLMKRIAEIKKSEENVF